jgi:hypothetical protein
MFSVEQVGAPPVFITFAENGWITLDQIYCVFSIADITPSLSIN